MSLGFPARRSRWFVARAMSAAAALVALSVPCAAEAAGGTGSIEGAITAAGGAPIAEVWACAYLVQSEEFEENCDLTGADGLYSTQGLAAGYYKVEFWSESTAPSYVGEYYDDQPFWEDADEIEVKADLATVGIDAELESAATIEGEISAATLGGPVGDVLACAFPLSGTEAEWCAPSGSDGTYVLTGLPPGEFEVGFFPSLGEQNLLTQFYDHEVSRAQADPISLAAGETKTGIDADLEPGAEIRGAVYSATTGAPVPKVWTCALFVDEFSPRLCLQTSSAGTYRLVGLETGSFKVAFAIQPRDLFGEEVFPGEEDDGYLTRYFDDQPTYAAADTLALVAPEVRTGIDGRVQPSHVPSAIPVTPPAIFNPTPQRKRARKHCRPGFRLKKVRGKRRCVKTRKHRRHRGSGKAHRVG